MELQWLAAAAECPLPLDLQTGANKWAPAVGVGFVVTNAGRYLAGCPSVCCLAGAELNCSVELLMGCYELLCLVVLLVLNHLLTMLIFHNLLHYKCERHYLSVSLLSVVVE